MEDTICAIATLVGESSINVIRVSGKDSIELVNEIFDKDLLNRKSHTITYGHVINNKEIVDEVLVSIFIAPNSFTRENVVEINSHGGVTSVNKILELLLKKCRLAEPGEFLKRAFLNGRIDLTEAEAVSDLITAKTENARKMAVCGINKEIKKVIEELRNKLVKLIGNIEVNIDYPEYEDAEVITKEKIHEVVNSIHLEIKRLVNESEKGTIIKNGINVCIVGKPNVGKSSLLNSLINKEKAIVTNIEGTTRDIVEDSIMIDGIRINFLDTAGIRNTKDMVEKIGVEKSFKAIDSSDLVLFVIDSESNYGEEDKEIFNRIKDKKVLIVYNKIDRNEIVIEELEKYDYVKVSALNKSNIDVLKDKISKIFKFNEIKDDYAYVSNSRQIALLKRCEEIGFSIEKAIKDNMPIDMIEIDVKELWDTLGEITGETYKEELLNEIFSRFCLGK